MKFTLDDLVDTCKEVASTGGTPKDVLRKLKTSRTTARHLCMQELGIPFNDVWRNSGGGTRASKKKKEPIEGSLNIRMQEPVKNAKHPAQAEMAKEIRGLPVPLRAKNLEDPLEVLDILKSAILRQPGDRLQAAQALKQVLHQYEVQNRVFLVAAANAELPRVVRLLTFLSSCEKEMFTPSRIENSTTKELSRLYALAQSSLLAGLDSVKKVADMRLDMIRSGSGDSQVDSLFDPESTELSAMADLPGMDPQGRDRVRKLVSGLMDAIDKDDTVVVEDESPSDD